MTPLLVELTRREEQVVELIAAGLSYDEIAVRLGLGTRTVRGYRDNARDKLGAASTPHLVAIFISARAKVTA